MATILQLGAGTLMKHSIRQIQAMGHAVYVVDKNPHAPAFDIAEGHAPIDLIDRQAITDYARQISADAILAVNEAGVLSAAFASQALGLRGLHPETAMKALDKGLMRQAWSQHQLSQPDYLLVDQPDEVAAAAQSIGFPVIVKPTMNWGSRGISIARDAQQLPWSIDFAQAHRRPNSRLSVESYIDGLEMSVEGLVYNGQVHILARSDKVLQAHERYCVDQALHYPADLPQALLTQVDDLTTAAVHALGLDNCAIHGELRVRDGQAYLIEMAARPGGGHIFGQIVEAVSGISMPQALTNILLDQTVALLPHYQRGAVYRFFTPPPGIFQGVSGIEQAQQLAGVLDFGFDMAPGTRVEPYSNGAARPGYCVTTADTREAAIALAERAIDMLNYTMQESEI